MDELDQLIRELECAASSPSSTVTTPISEDVAAQFGATLQNALKDLPSPPTVPATLDRPDLMIRRDTSSSDMSKRGSVASTHPASAAPVAAAPMPEDRRPVPAPAPEPPAAAPIGSPAPASSVAAAPSPSPPVKLDSLMGQLRVMATQPSPTTPHASPSGSQPIINHVDTRLYAAGIPVSPAVASASLTAPPLSAQIAPSPVATDPVSPILPTIRAPTQTTVPQTVPVVAVGAPVTATAHEGTTPITPTVPSVLPHEHHHHHHHHPAGNVAAPVHASPPLAQPGGAAPDSGPDGAPPRTCAACQQAIDGPYVHALEQYWHQDHLVCGVCQIVLSAATFFEHEGALFCQEHHLERVAPRCAYCSGAIAERCVTALGKQWHPEHFFCSQCGKPLTGGGFMEHEGKAYCEDDFFALFSPKCGACAKPVMADTVNALGRAWHPSCFVCGECKSPFVAGTFFAHEGMPYCELHYHARKGSLCPGCEKPIVGKCINAMGRKWHPEHFACNYCQKNLNKTPFKEKDAKAYCVPCHTRLYG
ncbi:hypothetical protein H9P43_001637 [Blastocladiella emersonii ATCC 22665]|nr:hypothetical protein H9P43_001637 [Blastocladiella emersonii ATCC 22665]